jgi:hypothetical protein
MGSAANTGGYFTAWWRETNGVADPRANAAPPLVPPLDILSVAEAEATRPEMKADDGDDDDGSDGNTPDKNNSDALLVMGDTAAILTAVAEIFAAAAAVTVSGKSYCLAEVWEVGVSQIGENADGVAKDVGTSLLPMGPILTRKAAAGWEVPLNANAAAAGATEEGCAW